MLARRHRVQAAVGMLMERHGLDHESAHTRLLATARAQRASVEEIAARLVRRGDDAQL